jgi:hypothetical protein
MKMEDIKEKRKNAGNWRIHWKYIKSGETGMGTLTFSKSFAQRHADIGTDEAKAKGIEMIHWIEEEK